MASSGNYSPTKSQNTIVHSNLDQDIIQVTEDRLRLVLKEHIERAEERKSWIAPLSTLIAIITSFVTADFRDAYFKAATWQAVFFLSLLLSVGWFAKTVWKASRAPTVDDIVRKIKTGAK